MDCLDKLIPPAAIKTHSQFPNPLPFQTLLIVPEANVYFWTGSELTLVFLPKPKNLPWIGIHNLLKSLYSPQMCLHLNLPSLPPRLFLMTCQFYPFMQQLEAVIKCKSQKHIFFQPNCNIVQSFWRRLELASKNEKKLTSQLFPHDGESGLLVEGQHSTFAVIMSATVKLTICAEKWNKWWGRAGHFRRHCNCHNTQL